MEHRNLGGLKISTITYGNWLTHDRNTVETAKTSVAMALDLGVSTFDTADTYGAPNYGAAEQVLGEALTGMRRESLEILTKVCLPTGAGPNDQGLSRKHIMESCHASLKRLRTDYVDLYQAHRFDEHTPLAETMTAFADLVRQGKILYLGVSEWTATQIREAATLAAELRIPLVANQPQYSMLWRVIEAEVVPTCAELGIKQIVWSPVAQGVLTGKYLPGGQHPTESRAHHERGAQFIERYLGDPVLAAVQRLSPIANDLGMSIAQLAVAWVLQNPNVASAILGASKPEQLRHNAAAAETRLDESTRKAIDEALTDPAHGDLIERDPAKTAKAFEVMQAWRS